MFSDLFLQETQDAPNQGKRQLILTTAFDEWTARPAEEVFGS